MPRIVTLTLAGTMAIVFPFFATGQSITRDQLIHFLVASDTETACALSDGTAGDREMRNTIVWPQDGGLRALVFRGDLSSSVTPVAPCWSPPGQCAVFEGDLQGAEDLCETSPGFRGSEAQYLGSTHPDPPSVRTRNGNMSIDPDLEVLAADLMRLANGLSGAESWVAFLENNPVYMADGERGTRHVRLELPSGSVSIARLRVALNTLDLTALENAITELGSRDLALVGPHGALSTDGRVYFDGTCFAVAQPNLLRDRLITANAAFALETPPGTAAAAAAFDDVVQGLLGGTPVYGAPISLVPEQDPRLLLYLPSQTDICP